MSKRNRKHGVSSQVDVVITTGGRWDFLSECLQSVRAQTIPSNIILLDNASDPEERIRNNDLFSGTENKRLQQRAGFPSANNEAARMGASPYIIFLNDDCALYPDAIEHLLAPMKDETVGITGAKLVFPATSTSPMRPAGKIQHIGMSLNIRGDVFHPLLGWSADHPKTSHPKATRDVLAVTGACLMIRRNLFREIGGFDLAYGMGTYEDVDLCFKVRGMGKRVVVNALAQGYHYAGATSEKNNAPFPLMQNGMFFKNRWMNTPLMMWDEFTYY